VQRVLAVDLSPNTLLVAKQIFRLAGQPGEQQYIAQAGQEYTGRTGQLLLVGTGPGQLTK